MDWSDCVVDVHSVKMSGIALETLFKNCGPVRSMFHWKGQGEKPHIFFEYKSPAAADVARAIGLDRSDIQVIKIFNNDMLKRKFRELAHGPIRNHDQRCRPMTTHVVPRSIQIHRDRCEERNASSKHSRLQHTPEDVFYVQRRGECSGRPNPHQEGSKPEKRVERRYSRPVMFNSFTSSSSENRGVQTLLNRQVDKRIYDSETLKASAQSVPAKISLPAKAESPIQYKNKPSSLLMIPHFGEIIKFDLDTQLEADPAGIIHILTAVTADQKFWMITAAHYKRKENLDAARKVLKAGIDMAVQSGMETDTKPFWYLLAQINSGIHGRDNVGVSATSITGQPRTPKSHSESSEENMPPHFNKSQEENGENFPSASKVFCSESYGSLMLQKTSPNSEREHTSDSFVNTLAIKPPASLTGSVDNIPTGPRERASQPVPYPTIETQNNLSRLQTELGILQKKQSSAIADLSLTRAAKRKAEDDAQKERSFRRKLEKDLRIVEDALKRSKRMEDAALDQVKREIGARRKAENLLAELRAKEERSESPHLIADPSSIFLHLASLLRNVNPVGLPVSVPGLIPSPVPTLSEQKPPALPCSEK